MKDLSNYDSSDPLSLTGINGFKAIDGKGLEKIRAGMLEFDRAVNSFGRNNSQTTIKMMSITMLSEGPYRRLRQCLSEIDNRRMALNEASLRYRRIQAKIKWKTKQLSEIEGESLKKDLLEIKLDEYEYSLKENRRLMEGALKDVASMQDAYDQIRETYGIPKDWDEHDFEEAEITAHIVSAFRLGFSDMISSGTISRAAIEYFTQFGINPYTAKFMIHDYISSVDVFRRKNNQFPDIKHYYSWLDEMAKLFGQEYKKAMKHIGLEELQTGWCQFRQTYNT